MNNRIAKFVAFMYERRRFWLLPLIVVLLVCGGFIVLTQGSSVTPFIYSFF